MLSFLFVLLWIVLQNTEPQPYPIQTLMVKYIFNGKYWMQRKLLYKAISKAK